MTHISRKQFPTKAEKRVITALVTEDITQAEYAKRGNFGDDTVQGHMRSMREKFGVNTNMRLLLELLRNGFIKVEGISADEPVVD